MQEFTTLYKQDIEIKGFKATILFQHDSFTYNYKDSVRVFIEFHNVFTCFRDRPDLGWFNKSVELFRIGHWYDTSYKVSPDYFSTWIKILERGLVKVIQKVAMYDFTPSPSFYYYSEEPSYTRLSLGKEKELTYNRGTVVIYNYKTKKFRETNEGYIFYNKQTPIHNEVFKDKDAFFSNLYQSHGNRPLRKEYFKIDTDFFNTFTINLK